MARLRYNSALFFSLEQPPTVIRRAAAHLLFENAIELRIAAEAGIQYRVQHGYIPSTPVQAQKPLNALAITEIHQRDPRLLVKQPREAWRAQADTRGLLLDRQRISLLTQQAGRVFDRRVDIRPRRFVGSLVGRPRRKQGIS